LSAILRRWSSRHPEEPALAGHPEKPALARHPEERQRRRIAFTRV